MKRNLLVIFFSFAILILLVLVGCGSTQPPSPTYIPQVCSIMIVSQHPWAYGTVYVSGTPTSYYLPAWGSVTVSNVPCGQNIPVYLVDQQGIISNTRYVLTTPGAANIVNFDSFPWFFKLFKNNFY